MSQIQLNDLLKNLSKEEVMSLLRQKMSESEYESESESEYESKSESEYESENYFTPMQLTPSQQLTKDFIEDNFNVNLLDDYKLDNESKCENRYIIKGPVQSGKTKTLLSHALMSNVLGLKTVVMTRALTDDAKQMIQDCNKLVEKHREYVENGKSINSVGIGGVNSWVNTNSKINNLVVLGNSSQLQKLFGAMEDLEEPIRFNLFIDEADLLLAAQESKGAINSFKRDMEKLVPMANMVFAVSATTQHIYYIPGFSSCGNILHVNYNDILYKSFDYLKHREIPKVEKAQDLLDKHIGFPMVLNEWDRNDNYKRKYNHPLIGLVKLTMYKEYHLELMEYIKNNTNFNWVIIIYNGNGIELYHPLLDTVAVDEDFNINGDAGERIEENKYKFKKANVQEALALLRKMDIEEKINITHISIIAGRLAGRAVRFSCSDYKWHISDEYLAESKDATLEMAIQSLRILGCFNDNNPLTLWCDKQTYNDMEKYYQYDHDITESIIKNPDKKMSISHHVKNNIKVKRSRLPQRKMCKNQRGAIGIALTVSMDNLPKNVRIKNVRVEFDLEQIEDENERKGLSTIKKNWQKKDTVYTRIIKWFDDNGLDKVISKQQLKEIKITNPGNYCKWGSIGTSTSRCYKILEKVDTGYKLNPVIKDVLSLLD